ncbi:MAG: 3-dehydroquinate synthase [Sphingobacteriales bacterium]|nr:MAG: 3-dehydroquinate synthase [Sphingobacteriales bacterium]
MRKQKIEFSSKSVEYIFDASFSMLENMYAKEKMVIVTDENVYGHHFKLFEGYQTIVLAPGEEHKQQKTVDAIIDRLLQLQADRQTVLVGVGGGVITDMAGYAAAIFKRGVKLVQVPTSILAMVDAAVGGKNGVDVGAYKNQVGTIYQPDHLLFDYSFLQTLPKEEWVNGFAEIIKHACIKDAAQFSFLQKHSIDDFINDAALLSSFIESNVSIKLNVVLNDEQETGERKLLNFGHTIGHAIEAAYHLSHGHAISIGMVAAAKLSERLNSFNPDETQQLIHLLEQYQLPVAFKFDKEKVWEILINDKKRENDNMSFILLDEIGVGVVRSIPLVDLKLIIEESL